MTQSFLRYKPQVGYIHNWLVAGPQMIPITTSSEKDDQGSGASKLNREQLAAHFWQPDSGIEEDPCEQAKFIPPASPQVDTPLTWRYRRCEDDHFVDWAAAYPPRHYLRAWAYTELVSPTAQRLTLTLTAFGPAQIWLNGQPILRQEKFSADRLQQVATVCVAEVSLVKGSNALLVRLEEVAEDPTPFAFALKVGTRGPMRLQLQLPTRNPNFQKQEAIELLAQRAYIERDLYAGSEALHVKWPTTVQSQRKLLIRVQKPTGQIVGQAEPVVSAGYSQHLLDARGAKDGRYQVKVLPPFDDFVLGLRAGLDMDVNILHSSYTDTLQDDPPTRAVEFLKHISWWTEGLYAELASMTLGHWKEVNDKEILRAMDRTVARQEGYDETLMGLLLMGYRFAPESSMTPVPLPQLLWPRLEETLLAFDYDAENVGGEDGRKDRFNEDAAILSHASHILAGQLYAERLFACNNQPGRWHQEVGEQRAQAWLTRRAQGGFSAWDSGESFVAMLLGLVALVDYAESEALSDLAAAILDKMLFSLALNSFQGIFGSTHGATSAPSITDARMEPTSPVSRLLWGIGCWNQHSAGCFALATSQKYGCPPVHERIALDQPAALWSRERHVSAWRDSAQGPVASEEVNKVTYKTPDFMLTSAQDYHPGEAGSGEHLWQATLGPSAVVFVNHPRAVNQKDQFHANFWRGNGVLPRLAQRHDLLIAIHRLPADDWLGYTHAHFPIAAFDEHELRKGWAFARKGDGYLAITASQGMKLVKSGPAAYRELRSVGQHNVWLCQMGRAAQDGSFADFQKAIISQPLAFNDLSVSFVSLRGEAIAFDWTGSFLVDREAQSLSGFPHYDSPYCHCELGASEMEIHFDDWLLRLNLDMSGDLSGDVTQDIVSIQG